MRMFLCLAIFCASYLHSEEITYGIGGKKEGAVPITHVQFFGERNSGTNYLETLILRNFSFPSPHFAFGWKHFPIWFNKHWMKHVLPTFKKNPFLKESEHVLFIFIFRDPYDWLQSFNEKTYYASDKFKKTVHKDFSLFIREPWEPESRMYRIETNPDDGSLFKNVIHLRTARAKNMLTIGDSVENAYFIRYEVIRDHPEEVIQEIASFFGIERSGPFEPVLEQFKASHTTGELFQIKEYPPISKRDLAYINKNLDPELESFLGYTLREP